MNQTIASKRNVYNTYHDYKLALFLPMHVLANLFYVGILHCMHYDCTVQKKAILPGKGRYTSD